MLDRKGLKANYALGAKEGLINLSRRLDVDSPDRERLCAFPDLSTESLGFTATLDTPVAFVAGAVDCFELGILTSMLSM